MDDCKDVDILVVTTTVGSQADAKRLARAIIDQRLAACVQIDPVELSVYRWEGKVCEEAEVRLSIKTTARAKEGLLQLFAQAHPYELPQFLCASQESGAAYAAWVRSEVA